MAWEFDVVKAMKHALDLTAEQQVDFLASFVDADYPDGVDVTLHDEHLFNETRLYEALGKDDGRTVLYSHKELMLLKAILGIFIGNKVRLDRRSRMVLKERVEMNLRAMEHKDRDVACNAIGKDHEQFCRCDADMLGMAGEPLTEQEKRVFTRRFLDKEKLTTVASEEKMPREKLRQVELRAEAKMRYLLCRRRFDTEEQA